MVKYARKGEKLIKHFYSLVKINNISGCHEWTGAMTNYGYGQYTNNYKNYRTHRFAWILKNGEIPDSLYVLHKCDNKKCVNVDHLFLGTAKDNAHDAMKKKRNCHLETHGCSKLTNKDRKQIVKEFYAGCSRKELAKKYNVHHHTIQNTINHPKFKKKNRFSNSRFTMNDINTMLEKYNNGISQSKIAKQYKVNQSYISNILKRLRNQNEAVARGNNQTISS